MAEPNVPGETPPPPANEPAVSGNDPGTGVGTVERNVAVADQFQMRRLVEDLQQDHVVIPPELVTRINTATDKMSAFEVQQLVNEIGVQIEKLEQADQTVHRDTEAETKKKESEQEAALAKQQEEARLAAETAEAEAQAQKKRETEEADREADAKEAEQDREFLVAALEAQIAFDRTGDSRSYDGTGNTEFQREITALEGVQQTGATSQSQTALAPAAAGADATAALSATASATPDGTASGQAPTGQTPTVAAPDSQTPASGGQAQTGPAATTAAAAQNSLGLKTKFAEMEPWVAALANQFSSLGINPSAFPNLPSVNLSETGKAFPGFGSELVANVSFSKGTRQQGAAVT